MRPTASSQGRVVLITGGRRVGGDLALMLAARGANVAMTYHTSRAAIERTIAEVEAAGARGLAIAADLTQPDQAENAVQQVVDRFGRLDALVNMASVFRRTPLGEPLGSGLRRHDRRQPRPPRITRPSPRPGQCSPSPLTTESRARS